MKIYKAQISKLDLQNLSKKEILYIFQSGTLLNEINTLIKLQVVSQKESTNDVVMKAQQSQSIFFLSLLAGKLFECYQFLKIAYFQAQLSKQYDTALSDVGRESLGKIKKYFGKENLVSTIRNKVAFHYDPNETENQIQDIQIDEVAEIYLAENQGNNFFYLSDVLRLKNLLEYTKEEDPTSAKEKLFSEPLLIAEHMIQFLNHSLIAILGEDNSIEFEKVNIGEVQSVNDISLPYFVQK